MTFAVVVPAGLHDQAAAAARAAHLSPAMRRLLERYAASDNGARPQDLAPYEFPRVTVTRAALEARGLVLPGVLPFDRSGAILLTDAGRQATAAAEALRLGYDSVEAYLTAPGRGPHPDVIIETAEFARQGRPELADQPRHRQILAAVQSTGRKVYGACVSAHIADLAAAGLVDVRAVLRPAQAGDRAAYITVIARPHRIRNCADRATCASAHTALAVAAGGCADWCSASLARRERHAAGCPGALFSVGDRGRNAYTGQAGEVLEVDNDSVRVQYAGDVSPMWHTGRLLILDVQLAAATGGGTALASRAKENREEPT